MRPVHFPSLVEETLHDGEVNEAVENLLHRKIQGEELEEGPRIPVISEFIESELARLRAEVPPEEPRADPERLDVEFRALLRDIYGNTIDGSPSRPKPPAKA